MHEQGILQSFSGSEGITDRPGDSRAEGDIEIHLARMIFAGSAVCQRDEIDVAPIVALVLHLSPDEKRQERQCAGERKNTVRIRSRLHRELDDIINESGNRQQLVRDGSGIGKERSLLFLLFDSVRLQDSAQIHIGVRLLPAIVASGFAKFTQGAPVVAGTAVVMAFECHRPGRFLNQHGGLVGVRLIERADGENPLSSPLPRLWRAKLGAVLRDPGVQIKRRHCVLPVVIRNVCLSVFTLMRHNILHLLPGHRHNILWFFQNPGHAVRTFGDGVALAVHCPGKPPDPRRIVNRRVDRDLFGRGLCDFANHPAHQLAVVRREVDPVHQLRPIAGIGHDGISPAKRGKPVADLACLGQRGFVFRVRAGHAGGSSGIAVDQKPAPPDNIRVGGRWIPPSRTQTVHRAGKQIGIDRINRDVNAAKGKQALQRLRDGGDVLVIEITGLDMLPPVIGADRVQHTHLEHVPGLKPEAQSMGDFICVGHCVLHGICRRNTVPS